MSSLSYAQASIQANMLVADDTRAMLPVDRFIRDGRGQQVAPWADGLLWPRSRFSGFEMSCGMLSEDSTATGRWSAMPEEGGGQGQKRIVGITRDSAGAVLGNCIVQGFLAAGDVFVMEVASDTGGYFTFVTPYTGQHYLVAYKAGSPDVTGATVNTLTPV